MEFIQFIQTPISNLACCICSLSFMYLSFLIRLLHALAFGVASCNLDYYIWIKKSFYNHESIIVVGWESKVFSIPNNMKSNWNFSLPWIHDVDCMTLPVIHTWCLCCHWICNDAYTSHHWFHYRFYNCLCIIGYNYNIRCNKIQGKH